MIGYIKGGPCKNQPFTRKGGAWVTVLSHMLVQRKIVCSNRKSIKHMYSWIRSKVNGKTKGT